MFFTDAVTAIAITLLILPLVYLVPEYSARPGADVGGFIATYATQLWSFVLSFVIIARLWAANHKILEPVERQSTLLVNLDLFWAFTVVLLPLPTALIATLPTDRTSVAFYIGTMTASSLLLTGLCLVVYRNPELGARDRDTSLVSLYGTASTAAAFIVALILGLIFPGIGYYWLLLLLLTVPLDAIVKPRLHARAMNARAADARNTADTPRG